MEKLDYFVVTAVYPESDSKDDCSFDEDTEPGWYTMGGRKFNTPEELMMHFSVVYPDNIGLMLNMNNRDAFRFTQLWRNSQVKS
jgi:hypothetical protein